MDNYRDLDHTSIFLLDSKVPVAFDYLAGCVPRFLLYLVVVELVVEFFLYLLLFFGVDVWLLRFGVYGLKIEGLEVLNVVARWSLKLPIVGALCPLNDRLAEAIDKCTGFGRSLASLPAQRAPLSTLDDCTTLFLGIVCGGQGPVPRLLTQDLRLL